jgi:ubiquitin C-terminal hydrolase
LKSKDTNLNRAKTIGIRNTGNSCYVNCVIQLLRHCPNLTNLIAKEKIIGAMDKSRKTMESYKITTLLNNAMNNLNLANLSLAISNIKEIRMLLSKPILRFFNVFR